MARSLPRPFRGTALVTLLVVGLLGRDFAAGPAGDHHVIDVISAAVELDARHQRTASCEFNRSVTSM